MRADSVKRQSGQAYFYGLVFLLALVVVFTNFKSLPVNTVFVLAVLALAVLLPIQYGLALFPLVFVYFGFSFLTAQIYGLAGFNNHTFLSLFYVCLAFRIILQFRMRRLRDMPKLYLLLLLYVVFTDLYQFQPAQAAADFSILVVVWHLTESCKNNTDDYRIFIKAFIVVILTVFLYNRLNIDNAAIAEASNGFWVGVRFVGVRDPNNFALWCNFCLSFLLLFDIFQNSKIKTAAAAVLVVGSFITQSMSGIVTLAAILLFFLFSRRKNRATAALILLIPLVLFLSLALLGPLLTFLNSLGSQSVSDYIERIGRIMGALAAGDYNTATTTRSWLWNYYLSYWHTLPPMDKLLGNRLVMLGILETGLQATHNSFIDVLFNEGVIGLALLSLNIISVIAKNIGAKRYNGLFINFIFILNVFFRSLSGIILYFPLFL